MADRSGKLRHLFVEHGTTKAAFTTPQSRRDPTRPPKFPHRHDPAAHARSLLDDINTARDDAVALSADRIAAAVGDCSGTFVDVRFVPSEDFPLKSLADEVAKIEIVTVTELGPKLAQATLFVPEGKLKVLERKIEAFAPTDPAKKPRNVALVSSLESIRQAVAQSFWTDPAQQFPTAAEDIWWEVWLRRGIDVARFRTHAKALDVHVSPRELKFPDRVVVLARATVKNMVRSAELLDAIAELRAPSALDLELVDIDDQTELDLVNDLASRITRAPKNAPSICVLDTGVDFEHPLLKAAFQRKDVFTCFGEDVRDRYGHGQSHGTGAAGLALYGDRLGDALVSKEPWEHTHHLESVKYIPSDGENEPELYGEITKVAVALAEIANPERARVLLNTVTADGVSSGEPSSWSAAIDQIASGYDDEPRVRRLVITATGNIDPHTGYAHPATNQLEVIEDPAQAWNAITVGAYTERTEITDGGYQKYSILAPAGHLSPASRTTLAWIGVHRKTAPPFKPDLVCEGGNWAHERPATFPAVLDSLTPLSTRRRDLNMLLTRFGATSGASALAANLAVQLQAAYPDLWPETVRALMIHSCRYTPVMQNCFTGMRRRRRADALLRCFGYGVPSLERALYSAQNQATLVIEREIQPFRVDPEDGKGKTNEMHLHSLPWPSDVLEALGDLEMRLRVTLSYFVEPNPGKRNLSGDARTTILEPARYPSFGLRFEVSTTGEREAELVARVNAAAREGIDDLDTHSDLDEWDLGQYRTRGSIHSDVWRGSAADLADKGAIAVYPVNGWWRFRHKQPETCERKARYALLVSIETDAEEVDVYTPIRNQIAIALER